MPLPYYYDQMPYLGDNHFGKETFTNRYFKYKQKAFYPIFALIGIGIAIATATSAKNMFGNQNITLAHSHLGGWGTTPLNTLDLGAGHRRLQKHALPKLQERL